jgi:hypothetical protein
MSTQNEYGYRFFLSIVGLGLIAFIILMIIGMTGQRTTADATPTPSYQTKNQEVLKRAQRDDILICIVGSGTAQTVRRALLVENSNADRVVAYSLNQRFVGGLKIYDYLSFDTCEIRILRPSETRVASDMLSSIILYGFDPPPAK